MGLQKRNSEKKDLIVKNDMEKSPSALAEIIEVETESKNSGTLKAEGTIGSKSTSASSKRVKKNTGTRLEGAVSSKEEIKTVKAAKESRSKNKNNAKEKQSTSSESGQVKGPLKGKASASTQNSVKKPSSTVKAKATSKASKGPNKVSVKDLKGAVKDLETIRKDLLKLAKKNDGQLSIKDIEKAIRFLDMTGEEEMDLAYGLADEGIMVVNEDGSLITAEVDEVEDEESLEDEGGQDSAESSSEATQEENSSESKDDDFPDMPIQVDIKVSDPVKLYLKNIGHFPVLKSKEEETILAKSILAGEEASKRLAQLLEDGLLDSMDLRERANLEAIEERGMDSKDELTNCNLKLVVSIAKHYVNRGMQFLDLIQEGNIGLMRAVDKFDYTRGFKFSTYATWWIRQAITRALADQARTIRIPVHMVETINKIGRAQRKLVQVLNRDPTPEEISQELHGLFTAERIREIQQIALDPLSLEKPVGEEEDSHVGDFIEDKDNESPSEYATNSLLKDKLNEVLNDLSERERMVIRLRYGLVDGRTQTLEEVGKRFNVTRERIRQIEAKAIKKLRQPKRSNVLKDFRSND